jgi:hypothetical protein
MLAALNRLLVRAREEGDTDAEKAIILCLTFMPHWRVSGQMAQLRAGNVTIIYATRTPQGNWRRHFGGTYRTLTKITDALGLPAVPEE